MMHQDQSKVPEMLNKYLKLLEQQTINQKAIIKRSKGFVMIKIIEAVILHAKLLSRKVQDEKLTNKQMRKKIYTMISLGRLHALKLKRQRILKIRLKLVIHP